MEPFEYKGFWWMPQDRGNNVYGILSHDGMASTTLDLAGSLGKTGEQLDIVHGITISGLEITLVNSFPIKEESTSLESPRSVHTLHVNKVIAGVHFSKQEDICFNKVVVHFSGLFHWSPFRGTRGAVQHDSGKAVGYIAEVALEDAQDFTIDGVTISLHHLTTPTMSLDGTTIKNDAAFHVEFTQATPWDRISGIIGLLRDMLTFSMQTSAIATKIEGFKEGIEESFRTDAAGEHVKRLKPLAIVYPQSINHKAVDKSAKYIMDTIISPRRGPFGFPTLTAKWFQVAPRHRGSLAAFLSTYNSSQYPDEKFSTLCTAIEAFHRESCRGTIEGCAFPDEHFDKLIKKLINAVDDEQDKKFVQEKMRYANEPNLRRRLKLELADLAGLVKLKDMSKFVDRTVKTRNYLAHMDSESAEGILSSIEIYHYSELLSTIMQMLVLRSLGCDDRFIKTMLRNRQYYFIREVLGEEIAELLPEDVHRDAGETRVEGIVGG